MKPRGRRPSSITSRLWRGGIGFAFLTVGAGTLIYGGVRYQDAAIGDEVKNIHPLEITTLEIRADFASCQAALGAYILTREPEFLSFYSSSISQLDVTLGQARSRAGKELPEVIDQQHALAAWLTYADQVQILPAGDPTLGRLAIESYPSADAFALANDGMLAQLRAESQTAINNAERVLTRAVTWSGILAGLAVLLALLAAFGTIRGITRPLSGLTSTLRRLSAGDHAARADLVGSLEAREVAQSVNTLADETDRLRAAQEEHSKLRAMARETGFRIREHLHADDVIGAAGAALEESLGADVVYLHVMREGRLGPPEGHEDDWLLPDTYLDDVLPDAIPMLDRLLKNQSSLVIQDLSGPEGDRLPPEVREPMRRAGFVSHMVTPFGVGDELLGMIAAARLHPGHPWTEAEIDAADSIAADLGRGLHHARLYEEENRLVAELKSVDRAKSDFVATVSHELRTPLTSVTGYIEMLLDQDMGQLTPEQKHALDTINRNTTRLQDLIEDLLTISAIEAGTFAAVTKPTNLLDIIEAAAEDAAPTVASKGITLTTALPPDRLIVHGDASHLARVMTNLVSNAVKFTPAGGRVELTADVVSGWAIVSVADTGIGIPDADQKDLFTRFFRASNATKRAIPGTGLGLAIVQSIVARHGGEISFQSQEGEGTTVTLRLPLAQRAAPDAPAYREAARRHAPPALGVRS